MSEAAQAADQNYDNELDAFLAEFAGAEPAAAEQPQAEPAAQAEVEPEQSKEPQQGAAAEAELVIDEEKQRLLEENQRLQHQLRSEAGRQAALQRKLQELRSGAPTGGPTAEELAALDQELAELSPTAAKLIRNAATAHQAVTQHVEQAVAPVYEQQIRLEQEREQAAQQAAVSRLTELHPDWQAVSTSQQFQAWLGTLPTDIRSVALSSNDPATAASFLTQFKQGRDAAIAQQQAAKQQKLANAVGVPGNAAPPSAAVDDYDALLNAQLRKAGVLK
ncbi:hypothetical protein [Chitinilyticum litopenaei]|uniref:hypothetical protein n=1 Tax=Chitinilyticum litopenaei TaxID=1121276 RepID=UPI000406651D|nr:hypothetical protein [Chitinilyticum litopenaei]